MKNHKNEMVMFIGAGRSGSTLIDILLDIDSDCLPVGELRYFFSRSLKEKQLCSCGSNVYDCDFWSSIALGFSPGSVQQDGRDYFDFFERIRNSFRIFLAMVFGMYKEERNKYKFLNNKLVSEIIHKSGKRYIIDSSKFPFRAIALKLFCKDQISLKVIHLVRDPRAVAFSWTTKKVRPEIKSQTAYMGRHSFGYSVLLWILIDISSSFVKLFFSPSQKLLIKYEDFCEKPNYSYEKIIRFIKGTENLSKIDIEAGVELESGNHSISGNPIRFKKIIKIAKDDRWLKNIRRWQSVLWGGVLLPFLIKYKYKV